MNPSHDIPSSSSSLPEGTGGGRLHRLANFFLLSFGYVGFRFLLGPVRSRLLTEQLSKPVYGALTLAVTTVMMLALFLSLGAYEFISRRLPGLDSARQKGWLSLVLRRLALPAWLLAGGVAGILHASGVFGSWRAGDVLCLWIDLGLTIWLLYRVYYALGRNRIGTLRLIQLFQNDLWFVAVFACGSWAAASVVHSLWIWTVWLGVVALAVFVFDREPAQARAPEGAGLHDVLAYGLPLLPMTAGEIIFRIADRYFLLAFYDISVVAEYMLAMNIAMMGYATGASLLDLTVPHLYAAANKRSAPAAPEGGLQRPAPSGEMRRLFSLMFRHVIGLGAVLGLAMAFFRHDIFAIIAGPDFRDAAVLMPWLAAIPLTFLLVLAASRVLLVENRSRLVGGATLVAAVANLLADFVAVPRWGAHGAALATLGSLLALSVFLFSAARIPRWIDRSVWRPFHLLAGIVACAIADGLVIQFAGGVSPWLRLAIAAVPTVAICWAARIITAADMALLRPGPRSDG